MAKVRELKARQVLDSRGRPTVEVDVIASTGAVGRAIVPSGASTGIHEAIELRDPDDRRYGGLGVYRAVESVRRELGPAIIGLDLDDQAAIDIRLIATDGTANKGRLGANAVLAVSLAVAHAAAAARNEELFIHLNRLWCDRVGPVEPRMPMPMVNMISGGLHAGGNLDIQDVLLIPVGARRYSDALEMIVAVYRELGTRLGKLGYESALVGDEGGYGPRLNENEQAFALLVEAIVGCGYEPKSQAGLAVDVASSHFYKPKHETYELRGNRGGCLDRAAMIDRLAEWVTDYPIISLEDGLAEDDWNGWVKLTERLGSSTQLIGDDLFVTQVARLAQGIERGAGNAVLIKLNQVGTLSETFDTMKLARDHGFRTVVSARSGETEDSTIADLAVATAAGQIKIGSVARSERLAKYNRLLRIEEILTDAALSPIT
jgi:enolase